MTAGGIPHAPDTAAAPDVSAAFTSVAPAPRARSLAWRLNIALSLVIACFAFPHMAWTFIQARAEAKAQLDQRLKVVANQISEGALSPAGRIGTAAGPDDIVIEVWPHGSTVPIQSNAGEVRFDPDLPSGLSTHSVNGEAWRFYVDRGAQARIYVAHRETSRGRLAQDSAMSGIVPALVIIPLVWLAILLTVRSALAVIDPLSARARRLDIGRLEPLPTGDVPAELMPLVTSINIMISRLAHSLQAEKKFIAEAAHEMRSPLTALRIQADNLGRTLADADSRAHFDELQQGIARNARLVNQLLNLARADAGPVPTVSGEAPPPATRVLDIVTDVIAARLPKAAARGIDLGAERMEDAHVACDAASLHSAIGNLVDNAINYSADGGQVDVSVYGLAGHACIEVLDNGIGIPEASLPRVFDRFFRASESEVEGSGLGLAIVKAIAERCGGTASVANRDDGRSGVLARICFPLY